MSDFSLKLILTILGGIVFSLLFILLAFVLPPDGDEETYTKKPSSVLEKVSESMRK